MKKIIFTILVIQFSFLVANAQWYQQNSGISQNLYDVKFINKNTGWTLGDAGIVLKTTNGGTNWINMPNPTLNKPLTTICPIDSNYVYFVGAHSTYIKTTNGGLTWIEIRNGPYGSGMGFESVYFLNKDTGWACGNMRVLRTTNGGLTFDSAGIFWGSLHDIYFKDFYNGVICGDGRAFKTTDGGLNWFNSNVPTGGYYPMFNRIGRFNKNYLWLSPYNAAGIYKTTNFATTWNKIDSTVGGSGIFFINEDTGFVGGGLNTLMKTKDGGFNWHQENTGIGVQAFITAIYFATDSIGWYVSAVGKIFHTTTGGQPLTIISKNPKSIPEKFILFQNYPNPFNSETKIKFDVAYGFPIKAFGNDKVVLKVFDILGREVTTLVNEKLSAGSYEVTFNAGNFPSGIYFVCLYSNNNFIMSRKIVLLR